MKKRMIALVMILVLGTILIGCESESTSTETEIAVTIAEESEDPLDIADSTQTELAAGSDAGDAETDTGTEDAAETFVSLETVETETDTDTDTDTDTGDASGTLAAAGTAEAENGTDSTSEGQITEDEALEIALADSGLSQDALTGTRVKTDTEYGSLIYEVDLYAQAEEYEYEIDAESGEILDKDYEYDEGYSSTVTVPSGVISRDEAVALVLARVDGATEWNLRIKLDTDDGQYVWEGDIFYDGVEYEFEISGSSGTFLEWER